MELPVTLNAGTDRWIRELIERIDAAGDETAARVSYRDAFDRLRANFSLHPDAAPHPSAMFESAAETLRSLAASCLPLGLAVAMHLYPFCVLECVPLPLLSVASLRRARLLRTIRGRSLILANAGSERTVETDPPVIAVRTADGIRVDGRFEYMSLASVADIVLFKAPLAGTAGTVVCAADLDGASVRIGKPKFPGSMRLSDTTSVTFAGHRIAPERCLVVPGDTRVRCVADYQRCWFQLFLCEIHLARLERLEQVWGLQPSIEQLASIAELSRLREYSLRLLDDLSRTGALESLTSTTAAMKLRVSLLSQSTVRVLRERAADGGADGRRMHADARELCYIRSQPTADGKLLRNLGCRPVTSAATTALATLPGRLAGAC